MTGGLGWWKLDEKGMVDEGKGGQDEAAAAPARRVMRVMICMLCWKLMMMMMMMMMLLCIKVGIAPKYIEDT